MLTVIVPHARPEFTTNMIANFRRQRGVESQLLVVENGKAIGAVASSEATVICSDAHHSDAMNTGLAWLRSNGDGPWARFDDDDYYGPDYLSYVARSLENSNELTISGMPWRFTMLDDGLHQFQGSGEFTGGTLAASSSDVADFPRIIGEDLEWCKIMREKGARIIQRSPVGYCYDRTTRMAPRAAFGGPIAIRCAFGPSLFYGPHAMSAVDYPDIKPICSLGIPTNEELFKEMQIPHNLR